MLIDDFIEPTPSEGKKYFYSFIYSFLVLFDMFSKQVKVFPFSKADSLGGVRLFHRCVLDGDPAHCSHVYGTGVGGLT